MNKNKKYKINSKIVTIGVLAVVVLVNIFVTLLVQKFPIKLDMTGEKLYEISDETKAMLAAYETPVDIYFVAGKDYESSYRLFGNIAEVLEKYAQYGKTVKYTSIDSSKNPTFGTKYASNGENIGSGSIILDSGDRYKVYQYSDLYNTYTNQQGSTTASSMRAEQVINAGLRYVASDEVLKAYMVKGHNESKLAGLEAKLADEGYTVEEINLTTADIPEDASLVIISAPMIDYTTADIAKLDAYMSDAGKLYVSFNHQCSGLNNLYEYLKGWGIGVNDDIAVENDQKHTVPQLQTILADYGESSMTSVLKENGRAIAYLPYSKSLNLLFSENNGIKVEEVLKTTENSYSTTDFDNFENTSGSTGAQVIAASATKQGDTPDKDAIIFVSGNSAYMEVGEEALASFGFANYDYMENVLNFLRASYEDYTISPKYLSSGRLMMDGLTGFIIGGIAAILIPLGVLIYGIVVWVRRRHL